jgi:hypothetical protein
MKIYSLLCWQLVLARVHSHVSSGLDWRVHMGGIIPFVSCQCWDPVTTPSRLRRDSSPHAYGAISGSPTHMDYVLHHPVAKLLQPSSSSESSPSTTAFLSSYSSGRYYPLCVVPLLRPSHHPIAPQLRLIPHMLAVPLVVPNSYGRCSPPPHSQASLTIFLLRVISKHYCPPKLLLLQPASSSTQLEPLVGTFQKCVGRWVCS